MICRTCLRRAAGFSARPITTATPPLARTATRAFTTTLGARNAAPVADAAAASTPAEKGSPGAATPELTPLTPPGAEADGAGKAAPRSSCPAGTPLNGLNYFKGKSDPVALPDEAYPEWLWKCLEVQKKADATTDTDAGDEFCSFPLLFPLLPPRFPPPPLCEWHTYR